MLRLAASRGGGPETRSGTVQSLKCCPCQQKRAARLQSPAPGSIEGGGPRNALGHRAEPEVLPLPAETSREARKCCAWQHRGGGHRPEPEVLPLPAETSREARKRLESAAAGSIEGGGPETRSGTVQSLKCCPCQQKRAARLQSAAPGSIPGGGPRNALGHRPEPEVLPLPAETSREAPKCCAWQHRGGGPRNALGHRPEPEGHLAASRGGAPKRARARYVCACDRCVWST